MLGLGLRSSQPPGLSVSSSPLSVETEIIGEGFDTVLDPATISLGQSGKINPYAATSNTITWASLPTGWAQGYDAVFGTSDPVVYDDISSIGTWGSRTKDGSIVDLYPLGWQKASSTTVSNNTGPNGAATSRTNNTTDNASDSFYLFTESSYAQSGNTSLGNRMFLLRTPGKNYSTEMTSSSNILRFTAQVHGLGDAIGDLEVWVDNADRSNDSKGVKLFTFTKDQFSQTAIGSDYQKISFDISTIDHPTLGSVDVRSENDTFYFYIAHIPPADLPEGGNYYSGDLAIDNIYVEEIA